MSVTYCSNTDCYERLEAEIYWVEVHDHSMDEFLMKCPGCGKINTVLAEPSIEFLTGGVLDWEEFFGITIEEAQADDGLVMEMRRSMYQSQWALKDVKGTDHSNSYALINEYQSHAEMELEILNAED